MLSGFIKKQRRCTEVNSAQQEAHHMGRGFPQVRSHALQLDKALLGYRQLKMTKLVIIITDKNRLSRPSQVSSIEFSTREGDRLHGHE
jgi:hypothetical protein